MHGTTVTKVTSVMPSVTHDGLQAYAAAYANDPRGSDLGALPHSRQRIMDAPSWRGMIYLSLIGYRASVRAIWAALLGGQYVRCGDGSLQRIADVPYRTHAVALPENGLTHFAMIAVSATRFLERGQAFYALREERDDETRFLTRFVGLFDLAVGVPVQPQWAAELWRAGLSEKWGLITPCPDARRIEAWRVEADNDAWLALLKEGIQDGRLK